MSNKPKASVHVKPCNIAQSELHNRRDPEYIKKLEALGAAIGASTAMRNSFAIVFEGILIHTYGF